MFSYIVSPWLSIKFMILLKLVHKPIQIKVESNIKQDNETVVK